MQNLARWTFASLAKHFETTATGLSLPYFVEGINEREPETSQADHVEMRVTGPFVKEISNEYYSVEVVANVLLTQQMSMTGNAYAIAQWAGTFQNDMLEPIAVYKYGSGADDDDSLIGCLRVKDSRADAVRVFHFGQVNGVDRIRQAEVDVLLVMEVLGATL